jgi:hypothetical protein
MDYKITDPTQWIVIILITISYLYLFVSYIWSMIDNFKMGRRKPMQNKVQVIEEILENTCWKCEGKGILYTKCCSGIDCACKGLPIYSQDCDVCNGSGIYKETHYIFIRNGIAIDGDTLK